MKIHFSRLLRTEGCCASRADDGGGERERSLGYKMAFIWSREKHNSWKVATIQRNLP